MDAMRARRADRTRHCGVEADVWRWADEAPLAAWPAAGCDFSVGVMWCMGAANACETKIQTLLPLLEWNILMHPLFAHFFSTPDRTRESGCGRASARPCHPCVVVGVAKKKRRPSDSDWPSGLESHRQPVRQGCRSRPCSLGFFLQTHVLPSVSCGVRRGSLWPPLGLWFESVSFQTRGLSKQSRLACLWAGMPLGCVGRLDPDGLSFALAWESPAWMQRPMPLSPRHLHTISDRMQM